MIRPITLIFFVIAVSASSSIAKGWRAIVPLHSTRQDVVRAFGHCNDSDPSCEFNYNNEFVHIEFAHDSQKRCDGTVQPETVLLVEVFPKNPVSLKKLGLKRRDFRAVRLDRDTKAYVDEVNGLVLKVREARVLQLDYLASDKDKSICSSYYDRPEEFAQDIFRSHVPVINVNCPSSVRAGDPVTFVADLDGEPRISFLWRLSVGKIQSGQGTKTITVDTSGLEGKSIVATVTLGRVETSCATQIAAQVRYRSNE
jgi:hypothetical protein